MKKWIAAVFAVVLIFGLFAAMTGCRSERGDEIFRGERVITDHAGRELTIPTAKELKRVYYTSALAQIFVFSLAP